VQRGVEVTVLELDDAPGGNSRAAAFGGLACPLGAHYLPQPGRRIAELQDLLVEFGVAERHFGRWQARDEHTVHAPAERRFDGREWQTGLLPPAADEAGAEQQRRFAAGCARRSSKSASRCRPSAHPSAPRTARSTPKPSTPGSTHRASENPACAGTSTTAAATTTAPAPAVVSAWAGLHYFASRHGFQAPDDDEGGDPAPPPITAPQGNGWLVQRLAEPLRREQRLLTCARRPRAAGRARGRRAAVLDPE
jgi:phytoene dehydrogenase-like protein